MLISTKLCKNILGKEDSHLNIWRPLPLPMEDNHSNPLSKIRKDCLLLGIAAYTSCVPNGPMLYEKMILKMIYLIIL